MMKEGTNAMHCSSTCVLLCVKWYLDDPVTSDDIASNSVPKMPAAHIYFAHRPKCHVDSAFFPLCLVLSLPPHASSSMNSAV
jgi:hypothetical protein